MAILGMRFLVVPVRLGGGPPLAPSPHQLLHLHLVPRRRRGVEPPRQVPRARVQAAAPAEHGEPPLHPLRVRHGSALGQSLKQRRARARDAEPSHGGREPLVPHPLAVGRRDGLVGGVSERPGDVEGLAVEVEVLQRDVGERLDVGALLAGEHRRGVAQRAAHPLRLGDREHLVAVGQHHRRAHPLRDEREGAVPERRAAEQRAPLRHRLAHAPPPEMGDSRGLRGEDVQARRVTVLQGARRAAHPDETYRERWERNRSVGQWGERTRSSRRGFGRAAAVLLRGSHRIKAWGR